MAKAQEIIFGAVEKQVGGVAEASATSSAKMSVAFGEVTESIGTALLPAFEKVAPDRAKVCRMGSPKTDPLSRSSALLSRD